PLQNIGAICSRVIFPIFSQRQEDNEWLRYAYLEVSGVVAAIAFPVVMGLIVTSEPLVLTLFGSHWAQTIPLLLILLPAGLVEAIEAPVNVIYQTKGRTDWMFRWMIITGPLVVFAFVIGLRWGVIGVAVAYVCTLPLSFVNCWIAFKLIRLS